MHHLSIDQGWSANFNGDFSGDVHFMTPSGGEIIVPYFAVEAVVAEKVRRERIATLADSAPGDLLR